ncbi:MAG: hypothetical protein CL785_02970 [Chloroflexi bacterium]|nr:hypothetical protein [Chloroflexota bacterium]
MNVAIVIPTINRPDFIHRQLRYYANMSCQHPIYIGDSSNDEYIDINSKTVKSYSNQLDIKHLHLQGKNDLQAIHELLKTTKEPYAAFIADDDILVPESLSICSAFLDNNPAYRMVSGTSLLSYIQNDVAYGPIDSVSQYKQLPLEGASASERLINFMSNYFVTLFYVHHTDEFMEHIKLAESIPDKSFRELLSCCASIVNGNAYVLNQLHMVRQNHSERYFLPDSIDWVSNSDWSHSYNKFASLLSNQLAISDGISVRHADDIVKRAFWSYFSRELSIKFQQKYRTKNRLDSRLLAKMKKSSIVDHGIRLSRRFLPGSKHKIHIDTILSKNSPHRESFQNIYRSIEEAPIITEE